MLPMRRHVETIEQSGGAKKEGAGADRAVTATSRRAPSEPGVQNGFCVGLCVVRGPRDQQCIDRSFVLQNRAMSYERHASHLHGSIRTERQQTHIVVALGWSLPVGFQKGVEGAGNVE